MEGLRGAIRAEYGFTPTRRYCADLLAFCEAVRRAEAEAGRMIDEP